MFTGSHKHNSEARKKGGKKLKEVNVKHKQRKRKRVMKRVKERIIKERKDKE